MAWRKRSGGQGALGGGSGMLKALGQMVGLVISLYVFDKIINGVYTAGLNTSVYFTIAISLITTMLPILGLIGVFGIVWNALRKGGLM